MNPALISAIVLAGGYSSRMGCEKAELLFNGKSLVRHQVDLLLGIGIQDVLLSGYESAIPGTRLVPDRIAHRGPLSGIHSGLAAAEHRAALVLAVDTPLVPPSLLIALMEAHTRGITIVSHCGNWEPLIGIYDTALVDKCEKILLGENSSIRLLFRQHPPRLLEYAGDARLLMNCNTPEDYTALLAYEEADRS